ncbi:N-acetyllactosaminide beta-1,3-N-acetylglucosaminyltransferase 2 [Cololabis saira]|uniref:N-acetyllactosaminide beta-1,3-N-acetylglucosaminyltransferase 2 n=1 Tax=Cololabis saira TaxID=129043 RepID=UPI002AD36F9E|nr:N-acetyllactosaminide beta-1,3-N-acetylglucosaminyltransferase 2 [Cololabis saira]
MRRFQTYSAMAVIATLFLLLFYSNLHLDTTNAVQSGDRAATTPVKQKSIPSTTPVHYNITISKELRELIPQNGAYWNRLLHAFIKKSDKDTDFFRNRYKWSGCADSQGSLRLNIHDFNSYSAILQSFLQHMNCKSPPILIDQPEMCVSAGNGQNLLLFAIKSTPGNFKERQAVRETWGKNKTYGNGPAVRTVFLLGSASPDDPDLSALLSVEAEHFRDILQWDFYDSFLNLSLKMDSLLHWTLKNCPQVSFVFSGDDDVFVNTPALISYVKSLEASKASELYVGHVISQASPLRDPRSKYYIPLSFYDGPYPAYAGGGGFLFSGALLHPLYLVSHVIPFFPIDDVYFAMCAKALGVSAEAHSRFQTFDIKEQDRENVCIHKDYLLIHRRTPQQIIRLWKGINNPLLTC